VLFSFVIVSVVGAFFATAYLHEDREREQALTESVVAVERLFHQGLEKDSGLMQAALGAIAMNQRLKRAFLAGDRQGLLQIALPLFEDFRLNHRITHFYFSGADRVNFLRVHKPDRYGDVIDRDTTLLARQSKTGARGIEIGPLGTLTLRVVIPWYDGDKLIGYLELGEEIDHITQDIHNNIGTGLMVLVYERFLDFKSWQAGRKMLGHEDE
jgi:hypothetical protein